MQLKLYFQNKLAEVGSNGFYLLRSIYLSNFLKKIYFQEYGSITAPYTWVDLWRNYSSLNQLLFFTHSKDVYFYSFLFYLEIT